MTDTLLTVTEETLREIIFPLTIFKSEVKFEIDPDGLLLYSTDIGSGTSIVSLDINALNYRPSSTITTCIEADKLLNLVSVLRDAGETKVNMILDNQDIRLSNMDLRYTHEHDSCFIRVLNPPSSEPDATVTVRPGQLADVLEIADKIASRVSVETSTIEDTIHVKGNGHKCDDEVLKSIDAEKVDNFHDDKVQAQFNTRLLRSVMGVLPQDETVNFSLRESQPGEIEYTFANGHGNVTIVLRPTV